MPDLLRSFGAGVPSELRFPDAVRPWQHVLDCLSGYLLLVDALLEGRGSGSWNFGPDAENFATVRTVADLAAECWGPTASWKSTPGEYLHEASLLTLDAQRSRQELGWRDVLNLREAVQWTVNWQKGLLGHEDARELTSGQIRRFSASRERAN